MENNNEIQKDSVNSLATLVPQVFYDVIARLIPGGIIILLLYISYFGDIKTVYGNINNFFSTPNHPSTFILLVFYFFISYSFSIFLWRQIDWIIPILEKIRLVKVNNYSTIQKYDSYLYDFIKTRNSSVGARITKLRAEKHLTEVFFIGLIYCLLLNIFEIIVIQNSIRSRIVLLIIILISIISILRARKYFCSRSRVA